MTSRKIYIAGPMRGLPDDNREAFFAVAKFLKTLWHDMNLLIVNPAETDVLENVQPGTCTDKEFQGYLRADITSLMTCDEIVLLPGWEKSEGASCEAVVARALGIKCSLASVTKDATGKVFCAYTESLKFDTPWRMSDWRMAKALAAKSEIDTRGGSFTMSYEDCLQQEKPKNIAEEAIGLVTKARNANYGPPKEDFERTAQIVHALIGVHMTASDIAKVMIAVKLSRETHKHKRDNLVDIIGYVLCMAEFYEDSKALKPGEALKAAEGPGS